MRKVKGKIYDLCVFCVQAKDISKVKVNKKNFITASNDTYVREIMLQFLVPSKLPIKCAMHCIELIWLISLKAIMIIGSSEQYYRRSHYQ